jgi:hypothetical protein
MRKLSRRLAIGVVWLAVGVGAAYGLGTLFVWLWAPAPTPENSSPPPEAFLFLFGALIGLLATVIVRLLLVPLWLRRRQPLG